MTGDSSHGAGIGEDSLLAPGVYLAVSFSRKNRLISKVRPLYSAIGFCDPPGSVMLIVWEPDEVAIVSVYCVLGLVVGFVSRNFSARRDVSWASSESTADSSAGPIGSLVISHLGGAGLVEA